MSSKQSKEKANVHDACVLEIAEEMKKDKWEVRADLPGFEKPEKIGPYTPDLTATKKGCMKRICEVVTEEMFQGDKQRYTEVKNYCDEYDLHFFVVDKDGKHKEIDPATYGEK
ncbi:MAG TPA: hypothetical protein VMD05_01020 [Candidatus Nanoarchaeia archaeon]|nr:hypothetical protein [Candidatus Nanoarchaeia archaeon]